MMRYQFIDRVVAFAAEPPPTLTIAKTFSATDDCFTGPVPDAVPVSLLIETLAMAGGHLIVRMLASERLPLLLKIEDAAVTGAVRPGETLMATVTVRGVSGEGKTTAVAQAEGEASVSGRPVLRCRLLYACVRVPGLNPLTFILSPSGGERER